jgi:hypothetical protein
MTMERLAALPLVLYDVGFGQADPTRRQLVERAQVAGVTLTAIIEVEEVEAAVQLAEKGVADTVVARAVLRGRRSARALHVASFAEPLWETFALIGRRGAPVSPATRAFVGILERRLEAFGEISLYGTATSGADG